MGLPSRSNSLSSVGLVAVDDVAERSSDDCPPPTSDRCSWPSASVMIWGRLAADVMTAGAVPASSVSGCCSPPDVQNVVDDFLAGAALNVFFSLRSTRLNCFFRPRHEWLVRRPLFLAGVTGSDAVTPDGCCSSASSTGSGPVVGIKTRASSARSIVSSGWSHGLGDIWVEYTPTGLRASLLSSSSSSISSSRPFKFGNSSSPCPTCYADGPEPREPSSDNGSTKCWCFPPPSVTTNGPNNFRK